MTKAQLELARPMAFKADTNWSIEIKFGDVSGGSGFILATQKDNVVGNKAISFRGGKFNLSNYADLSLGKGYYNHAPNEGTITSNCVMKLVNTYDAATKTNVLSLYKDGVLVAANMQNVTGDYNGGSAGMDMSPYTLEPGFEFAYLGCKNTGSFLLTMQIDYIKVETNIK